MDSVQLQGNHLTGVTNVPQTEKPAQTQQQTQTASQPTPTLPMETELSGQADAMVNRQFDVLASGRYQKAELHDAMLGQSLLTTLPSEAEAMLSGLQTAPLTASLEQQIFGAASLSHNQISQNPATPQSSLPPELQALADQLLQFAAGASAKRDAPPSPLAQLTRQLGREEVKEFVQRNGEVGLSLLHRLTPLLQDGPTQADLTRWQLLLRGQSAEYLTALVAIDQHLALLEREYALQPQRLMQATLRVLQKAQLPAQSATTQPRVTPQELMQILLDDAADALDSGGQAMSPRARKIWKLVEYLRLLEGLERNSQGDAAVTSERPEIAVVEREEFFSLPSANASSSEESLPTPQPALAQRVLIEQIPSLLQTMRDGIADAAGTPLLTTEGNRLQPEKLLWLNLPASSLSGANSDTPVDAMGLNLFAPAQGVAFDAVYQLVGFDPRTLPDRALYLGIKAEAHDMASRSNQQPLVLDVEALYQTIERLKDSLSPRENALGEILEEAWVEDRLHLILLRGAVQNGQPLPHSFSFAPFAPAA